LGKEEEGAQQGVKAKKERKAKNGFKK